jgi:hypothetical protein
MAANVLPTSLAVTIRSGVGMSRVPRIGHENREMLTGPEAIIALLEKLSRKRYY